MKMFCALRKILLRISKQKGLFGEPKMVLLIYVINVKTPLWNRGVILDSKIWSYYSNFTVSALATYSVPYQLQNIITCL